jgi:hypothetical protein
MSPGAIPAARPVIAGELLARVLAGGMAGDGLVSALMDLGVPDEEVRYYETEFRAGRTIVTVRE